MGGWVVYFGDGEMYEADKDWDYWAMHGYIHVHTQERQ